MDDRRSAVTSSGEVHRRRRGQRRRSRPGRTKPCDARMASAHAGLDAHVGEHVDGELLDSDVLDVGAVGRAVVLIAEPPAPEYGARSRTPARRFRRGRARDCGWRPRLRGGCPGRPGCRSTGDRLYSESLIKPSGRGRPRARYSIRSRGYRREVESAGAVATIGIAPTRRPANAAGTSMLRQLPGAVGAEELTGERVFGAVAEGRRPEIGSGLAPPAM